jgi:hypothetical protein
MNTNKTQTNYLLISFHNRYYLTLSCQKFEMDENVQNYITKLPKIGNKLLKTDIQKTKQSKREKDKQNKANSKSTNKSRKINL